MSNEPLSSSDVDGSRSVVSAGVMIPFILVTFCFALWGFANDITNPLVKGFGTIFNQGAFISSFVQFCFYGGYCFMAIPAAIFIMRFSYKSGILVGLLLYMLGGLLFIPASNIGLFWPFCAAFFIMTCGLSFLETSANPYIMAMGNEATATRRLNLAQSFNPLGSIIGILVGRWFIMSKITPMSGEERAALPIEEFNAIKMTDLAVVRGPYVAIGVVLAIMFCLILFWKMPRNQDTFDGKLDISGTFKRLMGNSRYVESVIAQLFYVGAQIAVWTYIVHYGTDVYKATGMEEVAASAAATDYALYSIILFAVSRFICTFLLKYLNAGVLLAVLATVAIGLCSIAIFAGGFTGLFALVAVSGCMSLMFPTIYGVGLQGLREDSKLAAAGLVMAIAGGSIAPMVQGAIIDAKGVNFSYIVPLVCFAVVVIFGLRVALVHDRRAVKASS